MSRQDVLVRAEDLRGRLGDVIVIDVAPRNPERLVGIHGAIPVDLDAAFAGAPGGTRGRQPLPELSDLEAEVRRWGADNDSEIVVYDDRGGLHAARGWWTLKWAGLENVKLLDGGFHAAERTGLPLAPLSRQDKHGSATLIGGRLPVISADEAAALAREGRLLDARGAAAFRGDPGQRVGGHIPGALNVPASGNLGPDGLFLSDERLQSRFAPHLDSPVGVSCGSGVSAAHLAAALTALGVTPALYVGSWSAWSADSNRPVAYGA